LYPSITTRKYHISYQNYATVLCSSQTIFNWLCSYRKWSFCSWCLVKFITVLQIKLIVLFYFLFLFFLKKKFYYYFKYSLSSILLSFILKNNIFIYFYSLSLPLDRFHPQTSQSMRHPSAQRATVLDRCSIALLVCSSPSFLHFHPWAILSFITDSSPFVINPYSSQILHTIQYSPQISFITIESLIHRHRWFNFTHWIPIHRPITN